MKLLRIFLVTMLLGILFGSIQPAAAQDNAALAASGAEQLERCFNLQAEDAAAVLGEAVNPTWVLDKYLGFCTFASVAASNADYDEGLLSPYGPIRKHHYVAVTVWPVGNADDRIVNLAFAILDHNNGRFIEFDRQFGLTALAELAKTPSQTPMLTRQFLPQLGEGALWYWQEMRTGHHLAELYVLFYGRRIEVQAVVAPDRKEATVRTALTKVAEKLMATAPHVQIPPTPTPVLFTAQDNRAELSALGTTQLERCFNLQAKDAEAVLGEAVNPTWSLEKGDGFCIFTSTAASNAEYEKDRLRSYGPLTEHHYVAVTVWPAGNAPDPIMFLSSAILDHDNKRRTKFLLQFGLTDLAELAKTPSQLPKLTRQFLPQLGEGALWYWQEMPTGHHLAGLYVLFYGRRIEVQALVAPDRKEATVRTALTKVVEKLMATAPRVQIPPTPTPVRFGLSLPTPTPGPSPTPIPPTPTPRPSPTPSAAEEALRLAWEQYAQKIYLRIFSEPPQITTPAVPGEMSEATARQQVEQAWAAIITPKQPYQGFMMGILMGMPVLFGETAALSAERVYTKIWDPSTPKQGDIKTADPSAAGQKECITYDGELFVKQKTGWVASGPVEQQSGVLTSCQQFFIWSLIDPFGPITTLGTEAQAEARITVSALGKGVYQGEEFLAYAVERVAASTGQKVSKIEFYLAADTGLPILINYIPTKDAPFPLGVGVRIEYPDNVVIKKPVP